MDTLLLALLVVATTFGCTTKDQAAEQSATADKSADKAHRSADDQATEVEQARGLAKAEAATAAAKAAGNLDQAHKEVGATLQAQFDAADRRFNVLKQKAATATGTKKKNADKAAAVVTTREATVMAGIAKLRTATGAEWDTTKTQVDADTIALNASIDAFETTLQ